jgi:hypothetical protein
MESNGHDPSHGGEPLLKQELFSFSRISMKVQPLKNWESSQWASL